MMFSRSLLFAITLWLFFTMGSAWFVFFTSFQAEAEYSHLMSVSDHHKKRRSVKPEGEIRQTRTHVGKQIIFNRGSSRGQTRLASEKSQLVLHNRGEGVELVEYFQDISCLQQEKLFLTDQGNAFGAEAMAASKGGEPEQLVRQLFAKDAIYSYRTGQLEAKEVEFTRFLCPGHAWPEVGDLHSPLMRGMASAIGIKLSEEPTFKAKGFHAVFDDWWNE